MPKIDHPTTKPESSNDLTMTVEFRQRVKVRPPKHINNNISAKLWMNRDTKRILYDAIDIDQGEVEILEIEE
jgi:hypothetical protein